MNITIVQGAFLPVPPIAGGAVEKLWFELGREFARRGLAVTHISRVWPGLPRADKVDGVAYQRLHGFNYPKSRLLAKLMDLVYSVRCLLAVKRSDVIVTNTFFLPMLLSWFARRGVVYVSVHRYPQGQMALYRHVDRLQCVSTAIADAVREQAPSVSKLVKVVPNYVPSRLDAADVTATWQARRRQVLFVGRVHPEKGVELLLDAFAAIPPSRRAGWQLRIVGPHTRAMGGGGEEFRAAMEARAQQLGLPVEWSGPLFDRDALNEAYRQARVFVYPSVAARGEAFPLAPLEAMARGCPVVTSDLKCFSDFVRPGVNADFFALADEPAVANRGVPQSGGGSGAAQRLSAALQALMADEPRQRAYSLAGLLTAQEFTLSRVADAFVDDFDRLRRA